VKPYRRGAPAGREDHAGWLLRSEVADLQVRERHWKRRGGRIDDRNRGDHRQGVLSLAGCIEVGELPPVGGGDEVGRRRPCQVDDLDALPPRRDVGALLLTRMTDNSKEAAQSGTGDSVPGSRATWAPAVKRRRSGGDVRRLGGVVCKPR
jgi:hypothetical protein